MTAADRFLCTHCGRYSYSPENITSRFCGFCDHHCQIVDLIAERARSERQAQGLPPTITDPLIIDFLAAMLMEGEPNRAAATPAARGRRR